MNGSEGTDHGHRAAERAAAVREFLALERRTAAAATAFAERLGLSRSSFYRLTKAYDGGTEPLRRHGGTGIPRLDAQIEHQITMALDRIGVGGRVADAHALVARACRHEGLPTPAREVVKKRMAERVRDAPSEAGKPSLTFDETGLGMAVTVAAGTLLPVLSLLMHLPSRRIAAHRLDPRPHPRAAFRLADALGLPEATVLERPHLKGAHAARAFGNRLGPFLLRPRAAGKPPAKHYVFEADLDEARRLVGRLIDEHNAGRPQV